MTLDDIRALVRSDMASVDNVIRARLKSTVPLVDRVAEHIISGGGKRLRPLIVVLTSRACGGKGETYFEAAAFIEFIHTATLLHDDVVDGSSMRRGRDTANEVFGNQASVLVGDFVYSRAFQMMAGLSSQRVMEIMADATNIIAEGEVLQLMNANDPETTEQRYLEVIYRKTARLFEAGAEVAAVLSNTAPEPAAEHWPSTAATWARPTSWSTTCWITAPIRPLGGKNIGDDLAEGKPTLPLIHALKHGTDAQKEIVRQRHRKRWHRSARSDHCGHRFDGRAGLHDAARASESDKALAALSPRCRDALQSEALGSMARFAVSHTT